MGRKVLLRSAKSPAKSRDDATVIFVDRAFPQCRGLSDKELFEMMRASVIDALKAEEKE